MLKKNIESRPIICGNIAKQPFMKNKFINKNDNFKNAKFVDLYGIYLPNHKNLTFKDIERISKCLNKYAKPIF